MATSRVLTHDEARRFYDRFGAMQDSHGFYEKRALTVLENHLELERARAVVELGCGTGRFAASLLRESLPPDATYLGLDVSGTMVDLARRRLAEFAPRGEVHHTDGSPRIEAPDAAFDRFVSTYVLDLLSPEDIRAVLAEARRVLEPSGLLGLVGLTFGEGRGARAVSWLWEQVYRLRPSLVGGCRPLEILSFLPSADWKVRHRGVVAPYAIASGIVVAERT